MKILPFPDTPIFLCYHNRAFPFGVVQANSPVEITKWVCTKGINCGFYSESPANKFSFAVSDLWSVGEHLMSQQTLQIQKDYLNLFNIDLLQILKTAIDNGCYIHGAYNEKYIPGKWANNREDHMHEILFPEMSRISESDRALHSILFCRKTSFYHSHHFQNQKSELPTCVFLRDSVQDSSLPSASISSSVRTNS